MILVDMVCSSCGKLEVDYWVDVVEPSICPCTSCGYDTLHMPACNGGTRTRWRFADWPSWHQDPDFYRGQTSHSVGVYEYDDDGRRVQTQSIDGDAIESRPRFADRELQAERRDRHEHRIRSESDRTPVHVDLRGRDGRE